MLGRSYILALIATFLFFMSLSAFLLLPAQLVLLGASGTEVGFIMGATQVATAVLMPIVGLTVHRMGPRALMVRGAILFAAASAALAMLGSISWLHYVARVAHGIAFAAFFVAVGSLVVAVVPAERRAQGIAIWGTAGLVTHALAPLIGEPIVAARSYGELYLGAAACAAGAALVSLLLPRADRPPAPSGPMLGLLRDRAVAVALAAACAAAIGFGTIFSFLSAFAARERLGAVGPFFAAYTATSVAVRLLGGRTADRPERRVVIVPCLVACSLGLAALYLAASTWHLAAIGCVYGLGYGFLYPALIAFVVDRAGPGDRPRAVALYNWAFTCGMLVAAVAFGPASDCVGMRAAYAGSAAVGLVAAIALALVRVGAAPAGGTSASERAA